MKPHRSWFISTILFGTLLFGVLSLASLDPAPDLDFGDWVGSLTPDEKSIVVQSIQRRLDGQIRDPRISATAASALFKALDQPTTGARPLVFPLHSLGQLRDLVGATPLAHAVGPRPPLTAPRSAETAWRALLSVPCEALEGTGRTALIPEVGLATGHRTHPALDACAVAQSKKLAEMMTAWSATQAGTDTLIQFIDYAHSQGHEWEVRQVRTFADFASLADERVAPGRPIRLPLWLDTGLSIPGVTGRTLTVPALHSEHVWILRGPEVTALTAFYLGIDGVGYFPKIAARPTWTGERISARWNSESVKDLAQISGSYLRQIRSESAARGNLRADGYGPLGICNDSSALIATAWARLHGVRTLPSLTPFFPLGREPNVAGNTLPASGNSSVDRLVHSLLARLPSDLTEGGSDSRQWVKRYVAGMPYELSDPRPWSWARELRGDLRKF